MLTISTERAHQLEIDFETDAARIERNEWQRAQAEDLHAVRDYVVDTQMIVYQPGTTGRHGHQAFDVQVVSQTACTCSRHRLRGICQHSTFAARLRANNQPIDTDTPVSAREIQ